MATSYERRHLPDRTWFHKRPQGKNSGTTPPPEECCILLETGAPDEILLEDGDGCIALEDC